MSFDLRNAWYSGSQKEWLLGKAKHHHEAREKYCVDLINGFNLENPLLLDAGCGDGVMTRCLTRIKGAKIIGVDYNPLRVKRAHEELPDCSFTQGDLLELPFPALSFDVVFCHHVLEHVAEDEKALRELARVCKRGGYVVVGVPNEGDVVCWFRNHVVQRKILGVTDHKQFYSIKSFKALVARVKDLELVAVRGVGGCLIPHNGLQVLVYRWKIVFDAFNAVARVFPRLSNSLYFVLKKEGGLND